jgi:choline-sulfatase
MLEKDGFLEDTIVIYTSDHGEMAGEYGLWGKITWRESSVRVPLTVQLPAHRSGNRDPATISEPVSLIDLFPTLCGLANISAPDAVDGTDLSTAIETSQDPDRPPVVSDNFVPWIEGRAFRMVRDDQYKYVRFRDGNELFFNLEEDPREYSNLLEDANSTQAAELNKLRDYVDDSLDFDAAIEQREADMSRAEEFELAIPPGHGNVYHMPDDRLVDAETPLYVPNLLTKDGPSAIADWPDADG